MKSLDDLQAENSSLRVENRSLKATNQALRDVEHEVNRLRHALNYRERAVFKLVPAEVITRDSSTWWRTVTVNRGKQDGIDTDMPVVTDEGLVGKTTTVSANITIVLLVSDENCRVTANVEGTREQGIVTGERVTGGVAPLLEFKFSVETGESAARPESLYLGRGRGVSAWTAARGGQRISGPGIGWAGTADTGGRFNESGGRVRGRWTQMIFFCILMLLVFVAQIAEFFIPPLDWMS